MDALEEALEDLRLNPNQTYADVARNHVVDWSNLSKRHRGVTTSREQGYDNQRLLNQGQSKALLHHIKRLTDKGYPPTHGMLRNFAYEICGVEPGKC
jgi:hypothetical protein